MILNTKEKQIRNELTKEDKIKLMEVNNIPVMTDDERIAFERDELLDIIDMRYPVLKEDLAFIRAIIKIKEETINGE